MSRTVLPAFDVALSVFDVPPSLFDAPLFASDVPLSPLKAESITFAVRSTYLTVRSIDLAVRIKIATTDARPAPPRVRARVRPSIFTPRVGLYSIEPSAQGHRMSIMA